MGGRWRHDAHCGAAQQQRWPAAFGYRNFGGAVGGGDGRWSVRQRRIVTVTGIDARTDLGQVERLTDRFPFVEWGVLFGLRGTSQRSGAEASLDLATESAPLRLSAHLCGDYVSDILAGGRSFFAHQGCAWRMFRRIQINTHAEHYVANEPALIALIRNEIAPARIICQIDGNVGNALFRVLSDAGLAVDGLNDLSHGAGVLPSAWESGEVGAQGYAGGLSPENVAEQCERIPGDALWIDAETHLRTDNWLDMVKVEKFLLAAEPWALAT